MGAMRIDLHTHSTVSDGTDSPAELVQVAAQAGLDVIALTDHDTTAGWDAATAALPAGLTLVPGAELSCVSHRDGPRGISVHLLAYLFDPGAPAIVTEQRRLRLERRTRLRAMAERMAADGLPVDADEIMGQLPADSPPGRPHLAQALVRAGLVSTVDEAFAEYLGSGRGYYLPRQDTPVEDAIDMIAAAGGVTVFAHPFARSRGRIVSVETLVHLAEHGLTGVEVDHPNHDEETRVQLRGLARELNLVPTGSSDYHGTNKTIPIGAEATPPESLEALVEKASGARIAVG
ncbi:PHP domain-containing protein [Amycolatopsis alkalitolerans]|uniref:PHP domain-containing protein n=1 Tax=Amycolatopsis alkalitolerans TaxID=2547244 RepID=A0A5C4LW85_9PSEU|nr:PHP domain-containing protein [Amycolatopsis alkalitolerans]TNC23205.1 PHP domain-containing protein [Amycolatopsis alkalitolerans]